jgi:hypothetical protein
MMSDVKQDIKLSNTTENYGSGTELFLSLIQNDLLTEVQLQFYV